LSLWSAGAAVINVGDASLELNFVPSAGLAGQQALGPIDIGLYMS